jgi:hypothetical protein
MTKCVILNKRSGTSLLSLCLLVVAVLACCCCVCLLLLCLIVVSVLACCCCACLLLLCLLVVAVLACCCCACLLLLCLLVVAVFAGLPARNLQTEAPQPGIIALGIVVERTLTTRGNRTTTRGNHTTTRGKHKPSAATTQNKQHRVLFFNISHNSNNCPIGRPSKSRLRNPVNGG